MVIQDPGQRPYQKFQLPWWALFLLGIVCFVLINLLLRAVLVDDAPTSSGAESFFVLDLVGIGLMLAFWMAGTVALARHLIAQR